MSKTIVSGVKIVFPEPNAKGMINSIGTQVFIGEHEISGITSLSVEAKPGEHVTATITVLPSEIEGLEGVTLKVENYE